jgi:beta-galactosidase/evolved beta-galactosidase subunit alpha
VQSGQLPSLDVPARSAGKLRVPLVSGAATWGKECLLVLRFTLKSDTPWASAGHEIATAQLPVPLKAGAPIRATPGSGRRLVTMQEPNAIRIASDDFALTISTVYGRVVEWSHRGQILVTAGPRLNFWRAPMDNDRYGREPFEKTWRAAGLHALQHRVVGCTLEEACPERAVLRVQTRVAPPVLALGFACEYLYTVYPSGDMLLSVHGVPEGGLPHLPRIGLQMTVAPALENVAWYGRGPGESYCDSREAALVGLYRGKIDDLYTAYIYPQENGNRAETRWLALTDRRGLGLYAQGLPLLDFSAHHYTTQDFERARHTNECGLGSGSCGPQTWSPYRVAPDEFSFSVRLRAFSADETTPGLLFRGPAV